MIPAGSAEQVVMSGASVAVGRLYHLTVVVGLDLANGSQEQ